MGRSFYFTISLAILLLIGCGVLGYLFYTLNEEHVALQKAYSTSENEVASTTEALRLANAHIEELSDTLAELSDALAELSDDYAEEKDKNDDFERQINKIAGTVGDLDKLSKTDEELLQKYSKVSFLNEHYVPSDLDRIDDEYVYDEDRESFLHEKVMPFLEDMLEDVKDDDIDLWVVSAYRSFQYQSQLKGEYLVTYGSGSNAFSADQGFSEHQLGTTVDFTTSGLGGGLSGFGNTAAYTWLTENAHKYGFVLSYPESNTYYVYEPWHWRFVGTELADDLRDDGKFFYDLSQREIDQYLLHIFD
ncbi:MAG: D-alanyl-D-alanine carboxypeptidase family protein [Candidatus Paceibacterota bacterium]